jgi:hypothetical protein
MHACSSGTSGVAVVVVPDERDHAIFVGGRAFDHPRFDQNAVALELFEELGADRKLPMFGIALVDLAAGGELDPSRFLRVVGPELERGRVRDDVFGERARGDVLVEARAGEPFTAAARRKQEEDGPPFQIGGIFTHDSRESYGKVGLVHGEPDRLRAITLPAPVRNAASSGGDRQR